MTDLAHPAPRYHSRDEYRRWYDAQPRGRYERQDGRIVPTAPERGAHVRMKAAVYLALHRAVGEAGVPCEAFLKGLAVETGDSDYEPDAVVNCGLIADDAVAFPNPVVVVEVLSPGAVATDTGGKLAGSFRVPSIHHYLIVHPTRRSVIHHRRTDDGIHTRIVATGPIAMTPPGITIDMDELYGPASP